MVLPGEYCLSERQNPHAGSEVSMCSEIVIWVTWLTHTHRERERERKEREELEESEREGRESSERSLQD